MSSHFNKEYIYTKGGKEENLKQKMQNMSFIYRNYLKKKYMRTKYIVIFKIYMHIQDKLKVIQKVKIMVNDKLGISSEKKIGSNF